MGWDDNPDAAAGATLTNVLLVGDSPLGGGGLCAGGSYGSRPQYNQGGFAWKGGSAAHTRTLQLDGFKTTGLGDAVVWDSACWSPMPLVSLWRQNGTLHLIGNDVFMSAPTGSYPNPTTQVQLCGLDTSRVESSYSCGTDDVTGGGLDC